MKARGGRFLLILGAGLAAMAFVVVYLVMSKSSAPADQTASVPDVTVMKTIVVAKKDIPAYTVLDDSNLGLLEVEASTAPLDAVTDPALLHKKLSNVRLAVNKPVLESQVSSVGFSNTLAKGEKAFSLPVNSRNTFADGISEGDHVDVLWTNMFKVNVPYRAEEGKIKYEKDVYTSTKTLLQDVKVIRVVSLRPSLPQPNGGGAEGGAQTAGNNQQPQPSLSSLYEDYAPYSAVLVLAVSDQQVELLKYAQDTGEGQLDLTLRSSAPLRDADGNPVKDASGNEIRGDHDIEKTTGLTIDLLVESYGLIPPPAEWGAAPLP
ncbi:MAG TPA: Flp pilus assembly protein CpaB [Chloroflexia bacterium]|nr:Flp pilus assembly protein CpaB [Chloroflexia bacterium]